MKRKVNYDSEYRLFTKALVAIGMFLYVAGYSYHRSHGGYGDYVITMIALASAFSFFATVRFFKARPMRTKATWLDQFIERNIPSKTERRRIRAHNRMARARRRNIAKHRRNAELGDAYNAMLNS